MFQFTNSYYSGGITSTKQAVEFCSLLDDLTYDGDGVPPALHHAQRSDLAAEARGYAAGGSKDGGYQDPATGCARIHTALAA